MKYENLKLYDTHTHLVSENLTDSAKQIVERAKDNHVTYINSICAELKDIPHVLSHIKEFNNVFGTLGVIPTSANTVKDVKELDVIKKLAKENPKIVAVGEIGLDYYWSRENKAWQKTIFEYQMDIAVELGLPVNIHCRDAYDDLYEILLKYPSVTKIVHCFCQPWEVAKRFVELGCWFSIPGAITFKRSVKEREMISKLPVDKILLETDAPYLAPMPFRGKTNRPEYCLYTLETIAQARSTEIKELADIILENSIEVFGLKKRNLI